MAVIPAEMQIDAVRYANIRAWIDWNSILAWAILSNLSLLILYFWIASLLFSSWSPVIFSDSCVNHPGDSSQTEFSKFLGEATAEEVMGAPLAGGVIGAALAGWVIGAVLAGVIRGINRIPLRSMDQLLGSVCLVGEFIAHSSCQTGPDYSDGDLVATTRSRIY